MSSASRIYHYNVNINNHIIIQENDDNKAKIGAGTSGYAGRKKNYIKIHKFIHLPILSKKLNNYFTRSP
jgi:hypothetical protein